MNFDVEVPPLTNTIAYTLQGLMELGAILDEAEFIDRARSAAAAMYQHQDEVMGSLPGQLNEGWRPIKGWTSLTGNSQMAIVGYRLAALTGDTAWCRKAQFANDLCRRLQEIDHQNLDRRGAVRGSYPGHLGYGSYWYMNWTQKFYLDALLCEMGIDVN